MSNKIYLLAFVLLMLLSCSKDSLDVSTEPGQSGSITRFVVHNQYMYSLNPNEVKTFDLQNPDKPQLVHTLPTDYGLETIIIYDNTIYLGSRNALYILSIDNPAAPSILSKTDRFLFGAVFNGCDPVVVKDQYAYSTIKVVENICGNVATQSALIVFDVSDKTAPEQKGLYFMSLPNGLGFYEQYLLVCDEGSDFVFIYDTSDPLKLVLTDYSFPVTDPMDLIVRGDQVIVATRTDFRFYDISNLENIRPLGAIGK
jgi:hypothetical protein